MAYIIQINGARSTIGVDNNRVIDLETGQIFFDPSDNFLDDDWDKIPPEIWADLIEELH